MIKPLTIVLLMSGCSVQDGLDHLVDQVYTEEDPRPFSGIDPDLQEYVNRWEGDTGRLVINTPIAIREINSDKDITTIHERCLEIPKPWSEVIEEKCSYYGALCYMQMTPLFTRYTWIVVDTQWWDENKHNDTAVEQLLYHELGHCVLGLDHNNSFTIGADGIKRPNSIMRSTLFDENELLYYELHKETIYIPELIGEKP